MNSLKDIERAGYEAKGRLAALEEVGKILAATAEDPGAHPAVGAYAESRLREVREEWRRTELRVRELRAEYKTRL